VARKRPSIRFQFLVVDGVLESALRGAIGPKRRLTVERAGGRGRSAPGGARRIVVTWARHLSARRLTLLEGQGAEVACIVLVGPGTPVEVLSEVGRSGVPDPARVLFVPLDELEDVHPCLLALVTRLSRAGDGERILHAWWWDEGLRILTTDFRRLTVPRRSIAPLRGVNRTRCSELEVARDGTDLAWPRLGLEVGLDRLAVVDDGGVLEPALSGQGAAWRG
jgi:hypothetical protein